MSLSYQSQRNKNTLIEIIKMYKYHNQCGVFINEIDGFIFKMTKNNKSYIESLFRLMDMDIKKYNHTDFCLFRKNFTITGGGIFDKPSIETTNFFDIFDFYTLLSRFLPQNEKKLELWRQYRIILNDHGKKIE